MIMDFRPNSSFIARRFPSLQLALDVAATIARRFVRDIRVFRWESVVPLFLFGNRTSWRLQARILGELRDEDALAFKSSVIKQCTAVALSVSIPLTQVLNFVTHELQATIIAQIATTFLSIKYLSQSYWIARSCFVLSRTFAVMTLYYAIRQQHSLGRLLQAKDVRLWIRGGNQGAATGRLEQLLDRTIRRLPLDTLPQWLRPNYLQARFPLLASSFTAVSFSLRDMLPFSDFSSSGPDDYAPDLSRTKDIKSDVIYHCFTPSATSVIAISGPQMMLTSSFVMLVTAFAIYFGCLWTCNLDLHAGKNDNRKVSNTYMMGLGVGWLVFTLSQLYPDNDKRSKRQVLEGYLEDYLADHPEAAVKWGIDTPHDSKCYSICRYKD